MTTSRVMLLAVCALLATTCVMGGSARGNQGNDGGNHDSPHGADSHSGGSDSHNGHDTGHNDGHNGGYDNGHDDGHNGGHDGTGGHDASSSFATLQDYVNKADSHYKWSHISKYDERGVGYRVMWLNMTSQQWLTSKETNASIWWHFVAIIVPDKVSFAKRGLMYMTGGNNYGTPATIASGDTNLVIGATLAVACQVVVTVLYQLPNAPIIFHSEHPPVARTEDGIIAYGWSQYLDNPTNPEYLARLPMTKAGVRAMDAATAFWKQTSGSTLEKWIVTGASKRGWTAWTVAACDPKRVIGFAPLVFDELNFVNNIHHHWRAYGGWSFYLADYFAQNITTRFDTKNFAKLMTYEDPIAYVDILTMPKLLISTGGDEFFMPDNNDWYWSSLKGEKHFNQFPNLEHSMAGNLPLVLETVAGFAIQLLTETNRPEYTWTKEMNGNLHLEISARNPPTSVEVWYANTIDGNKRRDFRLYSLNTTSGAAAVHPVIWYPQAITPTKNNSHVITYDALFDAPAEGWIGFNIQVTFPGALGSSFRVSTATSILPQVFPYADCYLQTCAGAMV